MPAPVGAIDPSFLTTGPEWQVGPAAPAEAPSGGFAGALGKAMEAVQADQTAATDAVRSIAAGTAEDPTAAIMALERARLSMQLAGQVRTKATEALQDVLHTQV